MQVLLSDYTFNEFNGFENKQSWEKKFN